MILELSDAEIERIATAVAAKLAPQSPDHTIAEAAKILRVSTRTVARMVARGRIPHRKVGARVLISRADIDRAGEQ